MMIFIIFLCMTIHSSHKLALAFSKQSLINFFSCLLHLISILVFSSLLFWEYKIFPKMYKIYIKSFFTFAFNS